MRIQASLRIGGHWVKALVLIDSGAEVNMIYPRLLGDGSLVRLDDHVAVSSLFNGKTETLGSCDLLTRVKDAFLVEKTYRPRFVVADIGSLDVILGFPWLEDTDPIILWKQCTFVFPVDLFTVKLYVSKKEVRKAIQDARWAMVVMVYLVVDNREDKGEDTVKEGGGSLP
jgi:hypothetical protein